VTGMAYVLRKSTAKAAVRNPDLFPRRDERGAKACRRAQAGSGGGQRPPLQIAASNGHLSRAIGLQSNAAIQPSRDHPAMKGFCLFGEDKLPLCPACEAVAAPRLARLPIFWDHRRASYVHLATDRSLGPERK